MMKKIALFIVILFISALANAQGPEITSWIINTTGETGYADIPSNIQQVQYSTNNVYISATCIPGYDIGPWPGNPNIPGNQNFVYKITRHPVQNTAALVNTGLGHIGVWSNGVSIYNAKDGMSYNNAGVWNRDAYYWEGASFDDCLGHPAGNGEYHHHVSPTCLYDDSDSLNHSPIIGYAFDGFPVYGAYGYANKDGTGGVKRMTSSYVLNTSSTRTNGPDESPDYPLGCFIEDFTFTSGAGDLDVHNGRFCITPDYPAGTYAYFVTIDHDLNPVYPYTIGPTYYGTVQPGNTGPGSGHNIVTEEVTTYIPSTVGVVQTNIQISALVYPNPANEYLVAFINPAATNNFSATLFDDCGRMVFEEKNLQPSIPYTFNVSELVSGIYHFVFKNDVSHCVQRVVVY